MPPKTKSATIFMGVGPAFISILAVSCTHSDGFKANVLYILHPQTLLYSKSECSLRAFAVSKREGHFISHKGAIHELQTHRNGGR